jgi:hypothetical protein
VNLCFGVCKSRRIILARSFRLYYNKGYLCKCCEVLLSTLDEDCNHALDLIVIRKEGSFKDFGHCGEESLSRRPGEVNEALTGGFSAFLIFVVG